MASAAALPVPAHKRPTPEEHCAADAGKKKKKNRASELQDINDYLMLEEIGEGASSVVAKARDRRTGATVAVKWIRGGHDATTNDDDLRAAVLREAGCLAAGRGHPGVVQIRSVATDADTGDLYIVMDLVAGGGSLRSHLTTRGRAFTEDEARGAMRQLLGAVEKLHASGTIHRDINPANILVGAGGDLKLCGFGSATPARRVVGRLMCDDDEEKPVGTLQYAALEQLIRFTHHGPEADVWALGCVMAEILAGEPLFTGITEDDMIAEVVDLRDDFVNMGVEAFDGTALDNLSLPGRELLAGLLAYDSEDRLTAAEALKHRWFTEEEDVEVKPPAVKEA